MKYLFLTLLIPLIVSSQTYTREMPSYSYKDEIEVVLDQLELCESSGIPEAINYNDGKEGVHSYGLFQFQKETFTHFGKRYGLPHDDIWSEKQQRDIAREMVLDGRMPDHWVICSEKIYPL